jgi:prepilin-type N-terminal cleavage/methylation domain-containing protein
MLRREKGLTLIELLASIAILGFIILVVYLYSRSAKEAFFLGRAKARTQETVREAMDWMVRDIRHAGFRNWSTDPVTLHRLDLAYNTTLRYQADMNQNCSIWYGNTIDPNEDITYRYLANSSQIERRDLSFGANSWEVIASNVEDFSFTYLDENNSILPVNDSLGNRWQNNDSVRVVVIRVRTVEGAGNDTTSIDLTSEVRLRNTFYPSR